MCHFLAAAISNMVHSRQETLHVTLVLSDFCAMVSAGTFSFFGPFVYCI